MDSFNLGSTNITLSQEGLVYLFFLLFYPNLVLVPWCFGFILGFGTFFKQGGMSVVMESINEKVTFHKTECCLIKTIYFWCNEVSIRSFRTP
jgi:hypothetical protein